MTTTAAAPVSTEGASDILEQFIHDVANLPAELAHLLAEIEKKDEDILKLREEIHRRDTALQKLVKQQGALTKHSKEDAFVKEVRAWYEQAQVMQDEKLALANKAGFLLDRHVKRLDLKIRDLQAADIIQPDPQLPSLLQDSLANQVPPLSQNGSGISTPLPVSNVANPSSGSTNVANAAVARMINQNSFPGGSLGNGSGAPVAGMQPHPQLVQRHRESSAGAADTKRRKTELGNAPKPSSNLARHSSLGPGTPKAATPAASSRAGSAGPRTKKSIKKNPPPSMRKKIAKGPGKKARRLAAGKKGTPSSTGEEESSAVDDSDEEDEEIGSAAAGKDGVVDDDNGDGDDAAEEENEDTKLYCICHRVSQGDMVACDNENCPYEWFHYECVGMVQEPKGRWLCGDCRKLPSNKVKLAR